MDTEKPDITEKQPEDISANAATPDTAAGARTPAPSDVVSGAENAAAPVPAVESDFDGEEDAREAIPGGDQVAPANPAADFTTAEAMDPCYYDEAARCFWVCNEAKEWVFLSEGGFKRYLKKVRSLRDKPNPGKVISPLDDELARVESECRIAYAGALAGYKKGLHTVAGRLVLVPVEPLLIEPVRGDWSIIRAFMDGLLVGEEPIDDAGNTKPIDQRAHFYGWLRHTVECFREGRRAPGLMLGLAGEPNCGKSFLALILRWVLGGGVGKPYANMTGDDTFNKDGAEHVLQLIDDENQSDTRLELRQKFASEVKKFVANNEFRLRAMHKDGFSVEVLRRLVVLVNIQGILVLPPLDGDVDDKLLLLKGYCRPPPSEQITIETPASEACWPAPMPTRTEAEKEAYRDRVRAELPAFLHWLLFEWKMPSHISGGRFIVRHWHHPQIVAELHELSAHTRLWSLIVRAKCVFGKRIPSDPHDTLSEDKWEVAKEWRGSAVDLEKLLKNGRESQLSDTERKEIPSANWLGRRLQLCAHHFGESVCKCEIKHAGKTWVLRPRPQDMAEVRA